METVKIKIKNAHALKLLEDLEAMDLIQLIKNATGKGNGIAKGKKLSERLSGSITKEQSERMQKELIEMRSEWERNT